LLSRVNLKRALIQNFRAVERCEIDFTQPGSLGPRRLTAIVGDNGSGKTTVLQALALTLSLATRRTRRPEELRWHGFLAERLSTLGPTRVEIEVAFEAGEIEATRIIHGIWQATAPARGSQGSVAPSQLPSVHVVFEGGQVTCPEGEAALHQLRGMYYLRSLLGKRDVAAHFREVGDVFWFDQYRNLGSSTEGRRSYAREPAAELEGAPEPETAIPIEESWTAGVEQLREAMISWWAYHTYPQRDASRDYIEKLGPYLDLLFPGTRLAGVAPRETPGLRRPEFYFLFERDGRTYDLAELSSGEQAVFPLLSEFVRLDIARSIVLVDELELHLHPPQQQALLRALRKLGPDCQFIITTHSPYLSDVIPSEEIVRLERGRPCL
jgi:energy-coupling factor transporter ATP-binding protein EcfA2